MGGYQIDLRYLRKEVRRHPSLSLIVTCFAILLIIGYALSAVRSSADTETLYPISCSGDWHHAERVAGAPVAEELLSGFYERAESSARPSGDGSRVFCSFPPRELSADRDIEQVTLSFLFARGAFGTPELTTTVPPIGTSTDASSSIEETVSVNATSTHTQEEESVDESADVASTTDESQAETSDAETGVHTEDTTDSETDNTGPTEEVALPSESQPEVGPQPASPSTPASQDMESDSLLRLLIPIAHAQEESATSTHVSADADSTESIEPAASTSDMSRTAAPAAITEAARVGIIRFSYTTTGDTWHDLGATDVLEDEIAFSVPITSSQELETLVVRVVYEGVFHEPVYLEGMALVIDYVEESDAEDAPEADRLIGIAPEYIGIPDLDQFTIARIAASDGYIAAVLTNPTERALFLFEEDSYEESRLIAHANDMALESPIAWNEGRLHWLGRANDVLVFDPRSDTYLRKTLVQSTTTPGALEARVGNAENRFIVHDGRISFRTVEGVIDGDDVPQSRDAYLKGYFESERMPVAVQIGQAASVLAAATTSETSGEQPSIVALLAETVERVFMKGFFSQDVPHRCATEPFRIDVSQTAEAGGLVTLTLDPEQTYVLESGDLPHGIDVKFGDGEPSFDVLPGWRESVPFVVSVTPDARKGDFTVPLYLTTRASPHESSICKLNINTLGSI